MKVNSLNVVSGGDAVAAVRRVISVCEAADMAVWSVTSGYVIQHIEAESYQLICPNSQIAAFEKSTVAPWSITGESLFSEDCSLEMIRSMVKGQNSARIHWLYQQFLKINAVRDSDLDDDCVVVIWDADTVPLRDINFVEEQSGRLLFYHGSERHKPYFETINLLLGNGEFADFSFISQCLPVRVGWVRSMLNEMESQFGVSYVEAVLRILPGDSGSEFSEYETIGTWIWRRYLDRIIVRKRNCWLRSGSTLFRTRHEGWLARALFWLLSFRYDYVAIERWKRPVTTRRIVSVLFRQLRLKK